MNRVLRSITRVPSKLAEWLDSFRMTCDTPAFTRWAKYLDPFTLKRLAGHESLETTMKYIHLNDAEFAADVVEMRVFSLMGGSDVWIPDGLDVEVSEFALMGGNDLKIGEARPGDGGPLLRLKLISIMGSTTVRRGRKKSRAERRLERQRRKYLGH